MKKYLALALVLVYALGLVGCGQKEELKQGDYAMTYFFRAKVAEVHEEYLLLEVFDTGNTNMSEGDTIEVSTDVASTDGCPEFAADEFACVYMARNTDDNPSDRLEALSIRKIDETGKSIADTAENIDNDNLSSVTMNTENEESSESFEDDMEQTVKAAYFDFLSGDVSLLEDVQLGQSWVDFYLPNSKLEYALMDLDGDDVSELLIQWIDSPESCNAVFHYSEGKLFCWNFDTVEGSSRDYPLKNGTMVHQYDYNGTSSWTGFRYLPDGEHEELFNLFARYEVIPDNDTSPAPYYEIDGVEVDQMTFESELEERITNQLDRWIWTVTSYLH